MHDFYHCRLLPSPVAAAVEADVEVATAAGAAAAASAAAAAAMSGRAVTLVLDLHSAHRAHGGLEELAGLDPERLQDAWVALLPAPGAVVEGGGGAVEASQAVGGGGAPKRARLDFNGAAW